jgi:SNF2 family DNA or RNA helicase
MIELFDYQKSNAKKGASLLKEKGIVYFCMQTRTGKTLTSLEACRLMNYKSVLFISKKKALGSIKKDYEALNPPYSLVVTNFEAIHTLTSFDYDCVIVDEAHSLKAYPKPSLRTKRIKQIIENSKSDMILLSGTPTPESYSDIYHQFWVSPRSPFPEKNFYNWARNYVKIKSVMRQGRLVNDYKAADEDKVKAVVNDYMISYTRLEAGFEVSAIDEQVVYIDMDARLEQLSQILIRDRIYTFKDGSSIVADAPQILQNKLHQISSGTVITDDGTTKTLDVTKARHIASMLEGGGRYAVYYKYKAEGELLKGYISNWTDSPEDFSTSDKVFICQIQSGSMGVDLSLADGLIFYNIDFSATNYWQARDRLMKYSRNKRANVYWVFSRHGIESKVFEAVRKKQDYTTKWFKKDYGLTTIKKAS